MNGASSAWITARKRLQSFTDYPLLRARNKATVEQLPLLPEQASLLCEAIQPICWDNVTVPLWHQWSISIEQQPKSKHKTRHIPCSSICSVTCRAVNRISLTYSNNRFVSGEPILPWRPPSEELYPLCLKVLFGLCEVDDTIAYIYIYHGLCKTRYMLQVWRVWTTTAVY